MASIPLWARKFLVDFVETGIGAIFALQLALPATTEDAQRLAAILIGALAGALISAARRAIPGFLVWLNEKLGTSE